MNRDEFLSRFNSISTKAGYLKTFKKFDLYLDSIKTSEEDFLSRLNSSEKSVKYETLQNVINFLKDTNISNVVVRNYFDNLFKYFLISGIDLDYTQKKLRLIFPRISDRRFEGFDREGIEKVLNLKYGSKVFKLYCRGLAGGGFRENELLQVTPRMILFNEHPVRVKLPAEITKFNIYRETFLPKNTARLIRERIMEKDIKEDQTIFVKNWSLGSLGYFEKIFDTVRRMTDLETPNRKRYQQNDITLHSFRAFFITTFTDHNKERFGHALSGHSKDLSVYFRKSLKQRQLEYLAVTDSLDFEISKKEEIVEKPELVFDELIKPIKRSAV